MTESLRRFALVTALSAVMLLTMAGARDAVGDNPFGCCFCLGCPTEDICFNTTDSQCSSQCDRVHCTDIPIFFANSPCEITKGCDTIDPPLQTFAPALGPLAAGLAITAALVGSAMGFLRRRRRLD